MRFQIVRILSKLYLCMHDKKYSVINYVFVGLLAITLMGSATVFADGSTHKIPGIDREVSAYKVPDNLRSMSTEEVASLRTQHQQDLEEMRNGIDSKEHAEQYMFEQLMSHDEVRLSITEVIPQLIEDYAIEGKFKDTLLGYRSTFTGEITNSRENVENLQDYQSYDFRFTAVYMSMLFAFQEHPEFYKRLKEDMVDDDTAIGGYRKMLDNSYGRVAKAKEKIDVIHSSENLEEVIHALDQELARRQQQTAL